jgi:endonuclease/exonuclease/phosphatase (EEP) superfamily protein YafD
VPSARKGAAAGAGWNGLCSYVSRMFRTKLFSRLLAGLSLTATAGTILSFSRRTHWLFRVWDFPRVQIATLAAVSALGYRSRFYRKTPAERAMLAASAAVVAYQTYRIHTYTPLARPTVRRAVREDRDNRITLLISNVLTDNRHYDRFLATVRRENPDVILAVELDDAWLEAIDELSADYPHSVRVPLDNFYGMVLFSRLELIDPKVEFLVQDDIPSIHTGVRLPSGQEVMLHGLHPRPPEPLRDEPSSPRDAELVIVGRAIGKHKGEIPTIVAGDLNDVAWSATSELFVRLSGLLDPRAGRGFFNSFNAKNPFFRYPLDHVFHSIHFELVRIQRLPAIGSDHFPILIELQYNPEAARAQEPSHRKANDEREADHKLEQEARDKASGYDRPRGE